MTPKWDEWVMWAGTAFGAAAVGVLVEMNDRRREVGRPRKYYNRQDWAREKMHRSIDITMCVRDDGTYAVTCTRWDDGHPFMVVLDQGVALSFHDSYTTAVLADAATKLQATCADGETPIM